MPLYHYTDVDTARAILLAGVLRAAKQRVYRDLAPDASRFLEIGPLAWLTINPILDGTVWAKLRLAGWPEIVGSLARVSVPDELCDVGLGDYCDANGLDYDWFGPMVQTGRLAGSDCTTWRLHDRDIPQSEWLAVEVCSGIDRVTLWSPLE